MTLLQVWRLVIVGFLAALVALPLSTVAAQEVETQVTVDLQEFEDSGVSGTAVLTATLGGLTEILGGDTQVSMELRGQELDGNHPTHIHTGTCDNFDPNPLYPLETVELSPVNREGVSETTVDDVTLQSLRGGDYVILVHQSPEELTNYLVCGEISGGTAGEVSGGTVGESDEDQQVTCAELEIVTSQARSGEDHAGTPDHSGNRHGEAAATETDGESLCLPRSGSGAAMTAEGRSDILLLIGFGALSLLSVLGASVIRQQRA